jgi:transglutaminase-like putative cysteine protease
MSGPLRLTIYAMLASMAAALSLTAVFSSAGWLLPVMIALLLVSASCALIRWSPLPSVLEPVTAAVAVLLWVTWLYARPEAKYGFVPDAASLRMLDHLARNGFTDIRKLPAPVPPHHGLILIAVVGSAVVALVVDLLTVTLRRAALAGIPLLALFTICAATSRNGVNAVTFIPAAAGFLMLLYADNRERVMRWGAAMGQGNNARPAPTRSAENLLPSAPASLGRRVGAAAIGISVVVPLAIPGVHAGFGGRDGDGGHGGNGSGSVTTIDPIVSVNHDLTSSLNAPVLNYTTSSPAPSYLRMTSLDQFANGTFTATSLEADPSARVSNGINVIPPSEDFVTTDVAVARSFAFRWLPMPTVATSVQVDGDWRYDPDTATTFSASNTTSGLRYTVVSSPNLPTPNQLAHADPTATGQPAADLATPRVSQTVRQLTRQVTAGANSKFDAALSIQQYLTSSPFSYTTHPPSPPGNVDSLSFFLTVSHAGFCQQYATAMAVMARLAGIPSRVAVGFTAGSRQPDGHWQVTTHDAHAWPELYFPEYGWLPFEPTPRGDGQTVTPAYARARPNHHGGSSSGTKPTGVDPVHKPGTTNANHGKSGATGAHQGAKATGSSSSTFGGTIWIILGALVVLALIAPSSARQLTRRRRMLQLHGGHPAPAVAWAELRDSTIDAGGPWDDARSPRQSAYAIGRWLTASTEVRAALGRLTRAEEEHRYSASPNGVTASLAADVRTIRTALRRRQSRHRGLRAVLIPPSTMRWIANRWSAMADNLEDVRPVRLRRGRRGLAR